MAVNRPSWKATRAALLASTAIVALLTACSATPTPDSEYYQRGGYGVSW